MLVCVKKEVVATMAAVVGPWTGEGKVTRERVHSVELRTVHPQFGFFGGEYVWVQKSDLITK